MAKFVVVDFYKEKLIDFVPLTWVNGDLCAWPLPAGPGQTLSPAQLKLKVTPDSQPEPAWPKCPVKIIAICDTLQKAREKTKKKEDYPNSNLKSSEPGTPATGRKLRKRRKIEHISPPAISSSSDLSSEDESRLSLHAPDSHLLTVTTNEPDEQQSKTFHQAAEENRDLNLETENNNSTAEAESFELEDGTRLENDVHEEVVQFDLTSCLMTLQFQQQELVNAFKDIVKEVQLIREDVQRILAGTKTEISDLRSSIPTQPAVDGNQMQLLEQFEDKELFVKYLSSISRGTVQHVTYAILERLFSNRLADTINFTGAHDKIAFEKSPLLQVVKCSVQNSFNEAQLPPENQIHSAIINWFRTSKARVGSKNEHSVTMDNPEESPKSNTKTYVIFTRSNSSGYPYCMCFSRTFSVKYQSRQYGRRREWLVRFRLL